MRAEDQKQGYQLEGPNTQKWKSGEKVWEHLSREWRLVDSAQLQISVQ